MRDIGIIINRDSEGGIYTRTSSKDEGFISGEMLAKSFANNIDSEKSDLFFDCISNGIINEDNPRIYYLISTLLMFLMAVKKRVS